MGKNKYGIYIICSASNVNIRERAQIQTRLSPFNDKNL